MTAMAWGGSADKGTASDPRLTQEKARYSLKREWEREPFYRNVDARFMVDDGAEGAGDEEGGEEEDKLE
ncbi:hypothetical protein TrRE_jg1117, partial [Triparma retinervis]